LVDILNVEDRDIDGLDLWSPHRRLLKLHRDKLIETNGKGLVWWSHIMGVNTLSEI
jgi:hypothetical protein